MNGNRGEVLRRIDTLFSVGTNSALTDGQLLERFTTRRDEAAESAFSVLVERHGPMVLRVSRSLVGSDDAHDVFQATFLVLARRAGSIRARDSVGSWLHGVALRVAAEARSATARRRSHERQAAEIAARRLVASNPEDDRVDLEPTIHEELGRIPERYRIPIILCYLEGLSHEQAAARLRWPIGTVRSRLARGRAKLGERLARRGLAPTALLAWATSAGDAAMVPLALATRTTLSAIPFAAGRTTIHATTSLAVASLTEGVLRIMFWTKLRITAAVVAAGAMTAGAAGFAGQGSTTAVSASTDANKPAEVATLAQDTKPEATSFKNTSILIRKKKPEDWMPTKMPDMLRARSVAIEERPPQPPSPSSTESTPASEVPPPPPPPPVPLPPVPEGTPTDEEIWNEVIPQIIKGATFDVEQIQEIITACRTIDPKVGPVQPRRRRFKCTFAFADQKGEKHIEVVYINKDNYSPCNDPSHHHPPIKAKLSKTSVPSEQPAHASSRSTNDAGSSQETRLKDVERKLDQILEKLNAREN